MKFHKLSLFTIIMLISAIGFAGVALAEDTIELRSSVISYDNASDVFSGGVSGTPKNRCVIGATNFAGFYYNLDDDISTEQFIITKSGNNKIDIFYNTEPVFQKFAYQGNDWNDLGYSAIGFFAVPYVALSSKTLSVSSPTDGVNADKIAPLVIDSRDGYQIKNGQKLVLGNGYTFIVNEIDLNGKSAWVSLYKDDSEIESGFLSSDNPTWSINKKILGEDVEVFRIRLSAVFQGMETGIVEIKGIWLVDFEDAFEVSSSRNYGKFETYSISESSLSYKSEFTLSHDKTEAIGNDIRIRFSEGSGSVYKFYLYKEYTKPGNYVVRSDVNNYPGNAVFTPLSFSGLYYDLDEDLWTEIIYIKSGSNNIKKGDLKYVSLPVSKEYEFNSWTFSKSGNPDRYFVLGIFGEPYVPLNTIYGSENTLQAEKIAKLVIDTDTKYTVSMGQSLDLGSGYSLKVSEINVNGEKVWLNLYKDNKKVADAIVTADGTPNSRTWVLEADIGGEKNIQVMRVHVSQVFQGLETSVVEIRGIWLIDYLNTISISDDSNFGKFEYDGYYDYSVDSSIISTPYHIKGAGTSYKGLVFLNKDNVSIGKDKDISIGGNMSLKTSGTGSKYYLYILKTIGGTTPSKPGTTPTKPANTTLPSDTANPNSTQTASPDTTGSDSNQTGFAPGFMIFSAIGAIGVSAALIKRNNLKKK